MGFVERYMRALGAWRRGGGEGRAETMLAAAFAATGDAGELGALLHRVKYADDLTPQSDNLARLLRLWTAEVTRHGRRQQWAKENTSWDAQAAAKLYRTVAELSLAHFIDGRCESCGGSGKASERVCDACEGTGAAPVRHAGRFVRERVGDMVNELHDIAAHHAASADARLHAQARTDRGQGKHKK